MKLTKLLLIGATALAGVASFGGSANALPTFTSGSLVLSTTTSTTTNLGTTTSFTLSTPVTLVPGTGDFAGQANVANVFLTNTINLNDATTFNFVGDGIGNFTANSGAVQILPSAPGVLSFFLAGTYTVGADFANAGQTISADETFSLTQTNGAGNAISISGTFQSPLVPPNVPEPATVALFGAGLLGLGALRLRKKA
jgi:hypothetical protein